MGSQERRLRRIEDGVEKPQAKCVSESAADIGSLYARFKRGCHRRYNDILFEDRPTALLYFWRCVCHCIWYEAAMVHGEGLGQRHKKTDAHF